MSAYPPEFEELWSLYPKRPGNPKYPAFKEWEKRIKDTPHEEILDGVRAYAKFIETHKDILICHTRTWLHQRRWESDYNLPKEQDNSLKVLADKAKALKFGIGDFWGAVECLKQGLITESDLLKQFGQEAQNWLRKRGELLKDKRDQTILGGG